MSENGKTYDPEKDVWTDKYDHEYIKNEFDTNNPIWIQISSPMWIATYMGSVKQLNWNDIHLPEKIKTDYREYLKHILRSKAACVLDQYRRMLSGISANMKTTHLCIGDITIVEWAEIWQVLRPGYRSYLRESYGYFAKHSIGGAQMDVYYEMQTWKARSELSGLRDVLQWHETRGALTLEEEKVLRNSLENPEAGESVVDQAFRLLAWLLLMTIKRLQQILSISRDGVRKEGNNWFVLVKPIKFQTGQPRRWCPIPESLAADIHKYSERKGVKELQEKYDRLIVWDVKCLRDLCAISSADARGGLVAYIKRRKIISPRTNKIMHVTPVRLRHTGATLLAFRGVARDLIQEILEHESAGSAQAYIDAISSEIGKAIDKADRNLGNIFSQLNKSFSGTIVQRSKR